MLDPTLLGLVAGLVDESVRGAATSVVATVAYVGFLVGPVYVGRWAAAVGLPAAMVAVAAVAVGLALLASPALRMVTGRLATAQGQGQAPGRAVGARFRR